MGRAKTDGVAPRTFRVYLDSYNEIIQFFAASPSGITGAHAIRELIRVFGDYCRDQRRKGVVASGEDLHHIKNIVLEVMEDKDE